MIDEAPPRRRQLTLFVPTAEALVLEAIRERLDPVQHRLMPAHVTLCREDELARFAGGALRDRLVHLNATPLTLAFGAAVPFAEHGVLLPCLAGEAEFQALRAMVLGETALRRHEPHLTLAHPRNPRSPHNVLATCAELPAPMTIVFTAACLIEQIAHEPWQVLGTYALRGGCSRVALSECMHSTSASVRSQGRLG